MVTMRMAAYLLACLACTGDARRMQTSAAQDGESKATDMLTALLTSADPSAGYQVTGAGVGSSSAMSNVRSGEAARMMARRKKAVARKAFDPLDYPGVQAPTGFWDPLNFVEGGDDFTLG